MAEFTINRPFLSKKSIKMVHIKKNEKLTFPKKLPMISPKKQNIYIPKHQFCLIDVLAQYIRTHIPLAYTV